MAELQALHWQQAECMETRAKSFVADGAKCHHLGHGFTQRWANMDGALGCQDHHRPLPPPQPGFWQSSFLHHTAQLSARLFWRCSIKLSNVNVMPSSVSRGSDSFSFSSTISWIGTVKRQIHKFIKPPLPTTESVFCVGLVVAGN